MAAVDTALNPDPSCRFSSASSMEAALGRALPAPSHARSLAGWVIVGALAAFIVATSAGVWLGTFRNDANRRGALPLVTGSEGSRTFRQISRDPTLAGPGGPSPDGRLLSFCRRPRRSCHSRDRHGQEMACHEQPVGREGHRPGRDLSVHRRRLAPLLRLVHARLESAGRSDGCPRERDPGNPDCWGRAARRVARPAQVRGSAPSLGGRRPIRPRESVDEGEHVRARRHLDRRRSIRSTHRVGRLSPYGASLSPDARYIVFDRPDTETRLRDIFIVDLEDGRETPLIHHESSDHTPAWTKDGSMSCS